VDDSKSIRQQVTKALAAAGFVVLEAADGVDGLQCANENNLSVLVLDVNMPRLSGLDMLDQLKSDPKHANLPVLMLTTEIDQAMIERAKRAGARGWMIKPVRMDHLVNTVSKLAERQ
jgi:two-component system chemotaxis response regulator CheY